MTPLETYTAFLKAKNLKPHVPPQHVLDAAAPFVARGLVPVPPLGILTSAEDRTIANDLLNRASEAAAAVKAGPKNRPNNEGIYAGFDFDLGAEFIARLVMNPGALTPLERRYSLIAQSAREDRHADAMALLDSWGKAPVAAPSLPDTITVGAAVYDRRK